MRLLTIAAFASLTLGLPQIAIAQDDPIRNVIEARQGFYKMLALNMGTLAGMAKGDIAYDEAAASRAGANIEALTQYDLPSLFAAGSASNEVDDTAAKADIWANMDDFRTKFSGLVEAANGVSDGVKGGQEMVGPVVGKLGGACKACHDVYREKG